ncbi:hypothetical protein F4801DRAFT_583865 [Xylaria longipes]|nr:hypothetical protein F4801DRAFT_583865 [Xylaria longipes]
MAECVAPSQEIYYAPDDLSGKHIEICVSSQGLAKLQRSFEDFLLALITSYGPVDGVFECVFSQTADWSMHIEIVTHRLLPRPGLTGRPPTCVQSQLVGDLVEEVYDILRSAGELLAELSRSPYYIADAVMWPLRGFVEDDDTTTTATTAAAITRHKRLYRGRTIRSLNPSEGILDHVIWRTLKHIIRTTLIRNTASARIYSHHRRQTKSNMKKGEKMTLLLVAAPKRRSEASTQPLSSRSRWSHTRD